MWVCLLIMDKKSVNHFATSGSVTIAKKKRSPHSEWNDMRAINIFSLVALNLLPIDGQNKYIKDYQNFSLFIG